MIGIVVELLASCLLLGFIAREDLSALGIAPSKKRVENLVFGILASAITCWIYFSSVAYATGGNWTRNAAFSFESFFYGSWWTLKSVLFEELIFRGALLYILISKIGLRAACFISAFCFGTYHWFSYNAFGDVLQMLTILMLTGIAGIMFAFSFGVTRSLYLPIGLHYGWNFVSIVIFSNGPLGEQLLTLKDTSHASGMLSIVVFIFQVLALPLIVFWYLRKAWKEQSAS